MTAVIGAIPQIIQAGIELLTSLITNLPTIIVEIVKAVPQIIGGIVDAFKNGMGSIVDIGINIVKGLWDGICGMADWLWKQISGFFGGIWDGICGFFGIHSPSKKFAEMGEYMAMGLGIGFGDEMDDVAKDMQNAIPHDFDTDVQASVNNFSGSPNAAVFDVTIPLSVDGAALTKVISRIQWSQNAVTVRNMGVTGCHN